MNSTWSDGPQMGKMFLPEDQEVMKTYSGQEQKNTVVEQ